MGLIVLAVFLLSNGYTYGWDDQHLEIPLLKSLIDPALYVGDYYIESLKNNFTSFLYPLLARIISIDHIPTTFFLLYLISRYFLFFWMYKIWLFISEKKSTAIACVLMIIVLGRVEEFLYRTFSHQEFALAIIFAGIYYFYKGRFVISAALLGCAANFHALYSVFPMIYLFTYLCGQRRKFGGKKLIKSCLTFFIFALPVIIWTFLKSSRFTGTDDKSLDDNWVALYQIACPQNFVFQDISLKDMFSQITTFLKATREYWILICFYALNAFYNERFREDRKAKAIMGAGFGLILFSFIFSYIFPSRLVLDLNLVRNSQFLLFFLMGYSTLLIFDVTEKEHKVFALPVIFVFPLIRFSHYVTVLSACFIFFWLCLTSCFQKKDSRQRIHFILLYSLISVLSLAGVIKEFLAHRYSTSAMISLGIIYILLLINFLFLFLIKSPQKRRALKKLFVFIPLIVYAVNFAYYHNLHLRVEKSGGGFWQMQRSWIDMQRYVKEHTPKQALILVPHDMEMGGFRIFSERQIICSYRDCGIIGFDYRAAVEWQRRLKEIESFKVFIDGPVTNALTTSIMKYKVNYIVFMTYLDPGENSVLTPVYKNEVFVLYKVKANPL